MNNITNQSNENHPLFKHETELHVIINNDAAYKNTMSNNILLSNHIKIKNKIIQYQSEFQNPIKKIMETEANTNNTSNHLSPLCKSLKDD